MSFSSYPLFDLGSVCLRLSLPVPRSVYTFLPQLLVARRGTGPGVPVRTPEATVPPESGLPTGYGPQVPNPPVLRGGDRTEDSRGRWKWNPLTVQSSDYFPPLRTRVTVSQGVSDPLGYRPLFPDPYNPQTPRPLPSPGTDPGRSTPRVRVPSPTQLLIPATHPHLSPDRPQIPRNVPSLGGARP